MKKRTPNPKQDYVPRPMPEKPLFALHDISELQRSDLYELEINGKKHEVFQNSFFHYAIVVSEEETLEAKVRVLDEFASYSLRPLAYGLSAERRGDTLSFSVKNGQRVLLELENDLECPLYILSGKRVPKPERITHLFESGKVYNIGKLSLKTDDVVYIEEGAVVCGAIHARLADHIRILGNGILYGAVWHTPHENGGEQLIVPVLCEDVLIEGITVLDGGSWHIVPTACRNVHIRNVNVLSKIITGDGIDIVGSEDVVIEDCFIRANDDCISIKAEEFQDPSGCANVRNIHVRSCLFWNAEFGNTLEIGYETRCDEISDVVFENCIVAHCQYEGNQSGGVLTIHNADRAYVHDIHYRNIIIEDAQEKLIDIKTLDSKYSRDRSRGMVCDIHFENISVTGGAYPVSIVRGFEMQKEIVRPHDIYFSNVNILGKKAENFRDLHMVVELSNDLHFS